MKSIQRKRFLLITVALLCLITAGFAFYISPGKLFAKNTTTVESPKEDNIKKVDHVIASAKKEVIRCCANPAPHHICVIKTILGVDTSKESRDASTFKTSPMVMKSIQSGISWIIKAQEPNGGWGSGDHSMQGILDPHAVETDPATTALVAMSILRIENGIHETPASNSLLKATAYLVKVVEDCPANQQFLVTNTGTQPQIKLGQNIDVILTSQYFTTLLKYDPAKLEIKDRVKKALGKCIVMIQRTQDHDGSWKDGGWAPVLQSALANNALESAQDLGVKVDTVVLNKSRGYQNGNFDATTKTISTDRAAGVMLYGLSSTTRASAKEAKRAKDIVAKAKKENKLTEVVVNADNLQKAGLSETEARNLSVAYEINLASQSEAVREDVMAGFGNNGGEEFLSFLLTGESMMMQGGDTWKKWYDMMTGKLINIQNRDGSWNGHHCITSPVFCTATCLLILSIHQDIEFTMPKKGF